MKCVKYEDIKIADIETITKTGFITEIIFDADTKTVNIKDDELKEAEKKIGEIVNAMKYGKNLSNLPNKPLTKKKFKKLLQSNGIQRNEIDKILKNNTEPYTYKRLYKILENNSKDERKC